MADATWGDCEPFGIDHGELDGLTPAECFVLGVEWQMIAALAGKPDGFTRTAHRDNQERLEAILNRRLRNYRFTFMSDDVSETWMTLTVQPKESE